MIVGLTGGIGSGKSTVADFFEQLGVPVYNSDKSAKKLMKSSKKVKKKIVKLLGEKAYNDDKLNKKYIGKKIFNDAILLRGLNAIVHPAVRMHFLKWKKRQDAPYVIQETALIFENDSKEYYDQIILVVAPEEVRLERIKKRDDLTKKEVQKRFDNQLKDEVKVPLAEYVIENTNLIETQKKVLEVHHAILKYIQ